MIIPTIKEHSDYVDSFAYAVATQELKLKEKYLLSYIKPKPWYIPNFLYRRIVSRLLILAVFNR